MELDVSRESKRRKCAPSSAANLPEEIMSEILLLLPARSVLRFRAVCRSWAALLSSPSFTDAYAAKAEARRMNKFVFFAPSAASPNRSTVVYSCTRGAAVADPLCAIDRVRTDFLCLSSKPCHGIMLFSDTRARTYWLCNPSTGECRPLPKQHHGLRESSAGLVYDDRTRECKVVHLFLKGTAPSHLGCEIYTLRDASRQWRPANKDPKLLETNMIKFLEALETEDLVTKAPPVFSNGCLHWLVYPNTRDIFPGSGRDAVLCFSVTTETFRLLNAPASVYVEDYGELDEKFPAVPIHLAELEGSLCLVHDLRRQGHGISWLDVWMLRDHGASEWSLDHHIAVTPLLTREVHNPRFITILGCCGGAEGNKDKKKILIATSQHQVYAYHPDTGDVELVLSVPETDIRVQKEAAAALWLGLYDDSLVRIGGKSRREKEVLSAVTEILLRLPVKSIAQSMLVCRQWFSLIESESFVATHMSVKRPMRILMANNARARRAFFDFAPVKNWLEAGPALAGTLVSDKIICSKPSHGLNLISTSSDDYLCNLCTGAIQCLGTRGKSHFSPPDNNRRARRHAFSVGRNVGFGFDRSTGEHVAVEIGQICGTLACMIKTSSEEQWGCIGKPPRPVSNMPPAHVDGTLYWMSEQMQPTQAAPHERVVVAFDISTRAFGTLPCEPCLNNDGDVFLVELNGTLSLVVVNAGVEAMDVWMMHKHGSWVNAYKIRLNEQPHYSLKTEVVVPLDVNSKDGRILLNTGRALGYYDTKTGALESLYSLDQMKLPLSSLAFPILCQESLIRIPDDELPIRVAPPVHHEGCRRCDHPEHADATPDRGRGGSSRSVLRKCEGGACRDIGIVYRSCCRRLFCGRCVRRCLEHSRTLHLDALLPACNATMHIQDIGLPLRHPSVPGPEFCYYCSVRNGDGGRHVFISHSDYVRPRHSSRRMECGYRMEGKVVKETWVRRYVKL